MMIVDVAVGVMLSEAGVLIAKRHFHQYDSDLWEFPGGKFEPDETALQALQRELKEEVAIDVIRAESLFTIDHTYMDRHLRLHVFKVLQFTGIPRHQEGQVLIWQPLDQLLAHEFPPANEPIIRYLLNCNNSPYSQNLHF